MNTDHVTVVYKWIAHPGKLDELTSIYREVTAAMAGPLVLGSLWRGVTRAGALAGFWFVSGVIGLVRLDAAAAIIIGAGWSATLAKAASETIRPRQTCSISSSLSMTRSRCSMRY